MNGRYPTIEALIALSRRVKCSLDWLLKNEGEAPEPAYGYLTNGERSVIETLAREDGREFEELLGDLVSEALAARGAALISEYRSLPPKEFPKLTALVAFVEEESRRRKEKPNNNSQRKVG